jgi:ATP-binding protein involved in chromosome partitioning
VLVNITSKIKSHAVQKNVTALKGVKNVIAVGSGKGGVGKSTVAVNLALALKAEGARVGMMDADIYGPSLPTMLGCHGKAPSNDGKTLEPMVAHDIQCISMGHMLDSDDSPVIWRGPMATSALQQLLNDSNWDDLDYLVIDLPPGTGDIQLTLCQNIPVTGAVIVTTPQDISLIDANKAFKMFEKVSVNVLGVIENMSTHICSSCGHEEAIFGAGGGEKMSDRYGIPLLGQIPLTKEIREGVDQGSPTVVADPESPVTNSFIEIARQVAVAISNKPKDFTAKMPKIVFESKS